MAVKVMPLRATLSQDVLVVQFTGGLSVSQLNAGTTSANATAGDIRLADFKLGTGTLGSGATYRQVNANSDTLAIVLGAGATVLPGMDVL